MVSRRSKKSRKKDDKEDLPVIDDIEEKSEASWVKPIRTGNESNYELGISYLSELKHRNKAAGKYNSMQVEQMVKDSKLNKLGKYENLTMKARLIEQQAEKIEHLIRVERKEHLRKFRVDEKER